MILSYRLHPLRYPANDGTGAALYGGRWNSAGRPVIYSSATPALAMLEVLVNHAVLPNNFVMTEIRIPSHVELLDLSESLPPDWALPMISSSTQLLGDKWIEDGKDAVLRVPSSTLGVEFKEQNYLINPRHPDFLSITFSPPKPFRFDRRLK